MKNEKIASGFIKSIVWSLVLHGLLTTIAGVLIFIYPNLLGMLVGLLLITFGIVSLVTAFKTNKYSELEAEE